MTTSTGYRDQTLIGLPDQVANVIRNHHSAGTLVSMTAPRPVSATDPRIRVRLRLVDTNPARPANRPRTVRVASLGAHTAGLVQPGRKRRIRRLVAVTAVTATVVAGLTAIVVYLVAQLVAFLVDHAAIIAGFLAIAAILTALLPSTGSRKRHCPGC
jgi:hypothetical protein